MNDEAAPLLDAVEARILGCLVEKQLTTPDIYPLTLNALVGACNQKTSRDPVMKLEPGQVGHALRQLAERELVHLVSGARADRWSQRLDRVLAFTPAQRTLIALLMLRGPQTLAELHTRSERMHEFADAAAVQATVDELIEAGRVVQLPRQPGKREGRIMHTLCGTPEVQPETRAARAPLTVKLEDPDLLARIEALEARIEALEVATHSVAPTGAGE